MTEEVAGNKRRQNKLLSVVPTPILDAFVRGDIIPFVGAGFSKNCDCPPNVVVPNWRELGDAVARHMSDYKYEGNPLDTLSAYEERFGRAELIRILRQECHIAQIRPGIAHSLLCGCFPDLICTTNFDTLIEDTFTRDRATPRVVATESSLSIPDDECAMVVKVHGDFSDPERMVVTERDYDLFIERNPLLCTFVSNLFITRTMLLVGYSLDDSDLRQLLQVVRNRLGKMARPVYSVEVDATPEKIARYKRRGVEVINIPCVRGAGYTETIVEFLDCLKKYKDNETQKNVTSNEEDSKEQLILSSEDNRLCYVSCSSARTAFLKRILDPAIRDGGAVPLWSDNVISSMRMSRSDAIDAVIRKASVRVFDLSDANPRVKAEFKLSACEDAGRTVVIHDRSSRISPADMEKCPVVEYFPRDEGSERDVSEWEGFGHRIKSVIRENIEKRAQGNLLEARRLCEIGEYSAALIAAWVDLESAVRREHPMDVSRHMMDTLMFWGQSHPNVRDDLFKLKSMRNRVVHGIVKATKKDAKFAIRVAEELLRGKRGGSV